tara:strand:+ start:1683 stop:2612 length:930 start_codon:yes stop_codon:yes gene_type:complete
VFEQLIDDLKSKNFKSISKLISQIENSTIESSEIEDILFSKTNNAFRIGITGPPGAGKSTLTNLLIKYFRQLDKTVGVLLVDPTSPFSGGSVLGDRVRMNQHYDDKGVFLRSLATRGSKGGLSSNISNVADILDVAGFDIIIFETVGVGQVEIDVVEQVDSVVLVLVPESGDDIQILKAGIIEISDIFVINKSDREGSNRLSSSLESMLNLTRDKNDWVPKIINTIAIQDSGVEDLSKILLDHHNFINTNNLKKNKINQRYLNKINDLIIKKTLGKIWIDKNLKLLDKEINKPIDKRISPNEFINNLLK